jgi:hypothetical protein
MLEVDDEVEAEADDEADEVDEVDDEVDDEVISHQLQPHQKLKKLKKKFQSITVLTSKQSKERWKKN